MGQLKHASVEITNAVKNGEQNNYVQRTVSALFSKRYNVCWCKTEQRKHTNYVISDEWETLKPKEDNVKKRETPSLALGIRKYFLMGKIWQPGLDAHERLWDSSVVVIAFVLFCKVSSSIVYIVRNSELYAFEEAAFLCQLGFLLKLVSFLISLWVCIHVFRV